MALNGVGLAETCTECWTGALCSRLVGLVRILYMILRIDRFTGILTQEMVKKLVSPKRRSPPQPIADEDEPVDPGEGEQLDLSVPASDCFEDQGSADEVVSEGTEEETDEIEWEDESESQG